MADVYTLGSSAIGSGVNAITNGIFSWYNNKEAREREEIARYENYLNNEKSAVNADRRTRALYEDFFSPQAQMQQIKEAGLSPSLFYGDTPGTVGQTGAQGQGAAGIQPTTFGMPNIDFAATAKLLSEARLNEAKTETEQGDNERGRVEIDNIYQDTQTKLSQENLNDASTAVQQSQEALNELQLSFQNETFWANVAHVEAEIENLNAQTHDIQNAARIKGIQAEFDEKTFDEKVKQYKQQGIKLGAEILNIKTDIELKNAEIEKTYDNICRAYIELNQEQEKIEISRDKNKIEREKVAWDNYNKKMDRAVQRLKLKLWRRKIELEHADRKAKMFVTTLNNYISTIGASSMKPTKKTKENYNPNGSSDGWTIETYE